MYKFLHEIEIEYWRAGKAEPIHEFIRKDGVLLTPEGCNWDDVLPDERTRVDNSDIDKILKAEKPLAVLSAEFCDRCCKFPDSDQEIPG